MNFLVNAKGLIFNLGFVRQSLILIITFVLIAGRVYAQEPRVNTPAGTLPVKNDTASLPPPDTLSLAADTLGTDTLRADTLKKPPQKGDIETTINYTARDSIMANLDGKIIWLYGEAKIKYGAIELEAEEVIIDYVNETITAQGVKDSLGNRIGYPIFKNGAEIYETKGITYNYKTRRARIREVVTQQGEGFLHSGTAFKNEKNEIFSIDNSYTTCPLEHPHFRIRAYKTKAIPNDKIVTGPFYMEFNDIPLPAFFLFGMFPAQRESKSGILFPSYGEERRRGFNLRNGGYFFDINEYIKLALTGDIYSKGGHAIYANSSYMKRYAYNGNFNFSYSKNRLGERIEDTNESNDFRLTWNHSPQSKGTGRFSASVNAATNSYNKNNNLMYGAPNELSSAMLNNITTKLSSNVSYNKRFARTPFSMGINLSHNQDLQTKLVDLPLPNVSLNMTNIYPFQRKGKTGTFDNFSIGYTMNGQNRITNNLGKIIPGEPTRDSIAAFNLDNLPFFIRNSKNGIRHTIPIAYSFKALKYFTVSPSINLEEKWYFERLNWGNGSTPLETPIVENGFNRITNYSFSASTNTRIYGMYFFKRGNVKAIRHIINPSVSFNYTPDFSGNSDYFQRFYYSEEREYYKSRHEGSEFIYGGSSPGKSSSIGFGITNNLEMKVKNAKDTVERKVMLLNNLSINSSYNVVADSFKLAPFGLAANTSVLNNALNINLSANIDPYYYGDSLRNGVLTDYRTKEYAWKRGGLGRLTNATLALNTNLNPEMRKKESETREKVAKSDIPEGDKQHILQNPNSYVDFNVPWSLNLGYNISYNRGLTQEQSKIIQTLQLSGDLSLSEKWKITYNAGYDFETKNFTQTNFGISRDLHCWTMNLTWIPFGPFESYNFTIAVKASVLQDLKLERRKPFFDNRP